MNRGIQKIKETTTTQEGTSLFSGYPTSTHIMTSTVMLSSQQGDSLTNVTYM